MGLLLLIVLAGSVLSVLYWVGVAAIVMAIAQAAIWLFWAVVWVISRPFVWFIVRPFEFVTGSRRSRPPILATRDQKTAPTSPAPLTMTDKVEQLHRLQALRDNRAITQAEFDKMKAELLA